MLVLSTIECTELDVQLSSALPVQPDIEKYIAVSALYVSMPHTLSYIYDMETEHVILLPSPDYQIMSTRIVSPTHKGYVLQQLAAFLTFNCVKMHHESIHLQVHGSR